MHEHVGTSHEYGKDHACTSKQPEAVFHWLLPPDPPERPASGHGSGELSGRYYTRHHWPSAEVIGQSACTDRIQVPPHRSAPPYPGRSHHRFFSLSGSSPLPHDCRYIPAYPDNPRLSSKYKCLISRSRSLSPLPHGVCNCK